MPVLIYRTNFLKYPILGIHTTICNVKLHGKTVNSIEQDEFEGSYMGKVLISSHKPMIMPLYTLVLASLKRSLRMQHCLRKTPFQIMVQTYSVECTIFNELEGRRIKSVTDTQVCCIQRYDIQNMVVVLLAREDKHCLEGRCKL